MNVEVITFEKEVQLSLFADVMILLKRPHRLYQMSPGSDKYFK